MIAEDLLLLLTDDDTGRLVVSGSYVDVALGGALLVELSMKGRAGVDARKRLLVRDPSPTGDVLLDRALETVLRREGKKPSAVLNELARVYVVDALKRWEPRVVLTWVRLRASDRTARTSSRSGSATTSSRRTLRETTSSCPASSRR